MAIQLRRSSGDTPPVQLAYGEPALTFGGGSVRLFAGDPSEVPREVTAPPGLSWSTDEQDTGRVWIDGLAVYQKTVDLGLLPNSATKLIDTGIRSVKTMIAHNCWAMIPGLGLYVSIPRPHISGLGIDTEIDFFLDGDDLQLLTTYNYGNDGWVAWATIWYTKV